MKLIAIDARLGSSPNEKQYKRIDNDEISENLPSELNIFKKRRKKWSGRRTHQWLRDEMYTTLHQLQRYLSPTIQIDQVLGESQNRDGERRKRETKSDRGEQFQKGQGHLFDRLRPDKDELVGLQESLKELE